MTLPTSAELEDAFAAGWERRHVEFKGAVPWNAVELKVVKAAMALSNVNGGGLIVCGADQASNGTVVPTGLDSSKLATYIPDQIQEKFNKHAAPQIIAEMGVVEGASGRKFFVIRIHEFQDVPVICKRATASPDGATKLEEGDVYYRNNGRVESARVHTDQDMREILELATEKRLRRLVRTLERAGTSLQPGAPDPFDAQLGTFP